MWTHSSFREAVPVIFVGMEEHSSVISDAP